MAIRSQQNAYSRQPGAASVWEDNKGRGFATPAGKVRNNLYFEPHGKFFGGKSIGSVANMNNVQTTLAANYAAEQFSATQGKNQWRYMYETLIRPGRRCHTTPQATTMEHGRRRSTICECVQHGAGNVQGVANANGVARVWVCSQCWDDQHPGAGAEGRWARWNRPDGSRQPGIGQEL